jgi:hypothetical protein
MEDPHVQATLPPITTPPVLPPNADSLRWHAQIHLEKRLGDWTGEDIDAGRAPAPYEVLDRDGNLLTTLGAQRLWEALIGTAITVYSNANAYLGVGDSATAASAAQTDLQAGANTLRKAMDSTYPQVSTNTLIFRSTFATGDANFAWAEWGTFNASSAGTMLNRKGDAVGTKASGATWTLTVTLSLT